MLLLARLSSQSDRLHVALPFFIAAVLILINGLVAWRVRSVAARDISIMFKKLARGDLEAQEKHFVSVAMWTADAAAAFVSIAGLVAAEILLLRDEGGSALMGVYIALIVAFVLPLVFWVFVLTKAPKEYGTAPLSWFQVALLVANLGLGVVILAFG